MSAPGTAGTSTAGAAGGLSLGPLRGLRPTVTDPVALGAALSPPYDVIDAATRDGLLLADPDNVVDVVLPAPDAEGYARAARRLENWVGSGRLHVDETPAVYIYEMTTSDGAVTRGLLGAVELRDPADGVILPHENTMAGPVADRLAVMTATGTDLEPIYLVYDGGGAASALVAGAGGTEPLATATTPDGATHRLWSLTEPSDLAAIDADLAPRHALIADGHHRYATYRERQRLRSEADGPGPWDRGLALLVDTSEYGPQVLAIHRVVAGLTLDEALERLGSRRTNPAPDEPAAALHQAEETAGFAAVLTDGSRSVLLTDPDGSLAAASARPGEPAALADLDVTVVHRGVIEDAWGLPDDVETVGYAHSIDEAIDAARSGGGLAILVRPTPVAAVAAVAAAGARMPRKSTLFTPKPASGLVMRRLRDQTGLDGPAAAR